MKLNYKRTFLVGLAFMSICMFWQLYDAVIPLILKNTFHFNDTFSGVIMAMDNVIALFLLPMLGNLSDRCNTKIGKRMPFIIVGTIFSVILMMFIPYIDNAHFADPQNIYKVLFVMFLGVLLVAMGTYRSPAVALMPDVTPKPLRSKANAIINLMGAIGGIIFLIVSSVLYSSAKTSGLDHVDYTKLFLIVGAVMLLSVIVLFFTIKEPKLAAECKQYEDEHPEESFESVDENTGETFIPKDVQKSLKFTLISIALWFMGYNAVTTSFTKFAQIQWEMSLGEASLCLTVATGIAILSYIPIGELASRIGRKKTIRLGVVLLAASFLLGGIFTMILNSFSPLLYIIFGTTGIAWAAINVNSFPMVVEMCKGGEIGKYTGYYYAYSMAAQIITPVLSGFLLQYVGYWTLFPYGALFVAAAFFTMSQVKHGDNRPEKPKSKLEMFDVED